MVGIRNPQAHDHGYLDEPTVVLELVRVDNNAYGMVASTKRSPKT